MVGAVEIELLKEIPKSRVFTVLLHPPKKELEPSGTKLG